MLSIPIFALMLLLKAVSARNFIMTNAVNGVTTNVHANGYAADLKTALRTQLGLPAQQLINIFDTNILIGDDTALETMATSLSFALVSMQNLLENDLNNILQDVTGENFENVKNEYDRALQRIESFDHHGFK